jgi:hypothetical protein
LEEENASACRIAAAIRQATIEELSRPPVV